jgi:hypothetical protein
VGVACFSRAKQSAAEGRFDWGELSVVVWSVKAFRAGFSWFLAEGGVAVWMEYLNGVYKKREGVLI